MQPELRQFIEHAQYYQGALRELAGMLPGDDAELDQLIAETVKAGNQKEFVFVLMAALCSDRKVGAHHLAHGAVMLPDWATLACAAWHMEGNVLEYLLDAYHNTVMGWDIQATVLFVAAAWCQEHRAGTMPPELIPAARQLARDKPRTLDTTRLKNAHAHKVATLRALAAMTRDAGLSAIILENHGAPNPAGVQEFSDGILTICRGPLIDRVLKTPSREIAQGTTMRRAVARIGRNEPCPCGSGKKYKLCCFQKDQERLHHSSDVAGHTREEVDVDPERHLTEARLDKAMHGDMERFDPRKIPRDLLILYFMRLAGFSMFDRMAEAYELVGFSEDLKEVWDFDLFFVTRAGRKDILERMLKWRPDAAEIKNKLKPGARLLLVQDEPARYLELLDTLSREALATEDSQALEEFAFGILESKHRALGIFVARSMVPLIKQKDATFLFEQILETRDKLNLSPDDPFSDIMDKRFAEHETGDSKEAAELRKAQRLLEVKAQEVRELKDSLERLQKEITRRERIRVAPAPDAHAATPSPLDEQALREMRQKVGELKSALKERHNERNDLRRELQKAHATLEEIRLKAASAVPEENGEPDREEDLLLPQDAPEVQPVRLMEFPKHFHQALGAFPRHVARAAIIMTGRLAAGEPAAFVGSLRLKATPNVMRQRIGSDYRLLFRLWPERVEIIDLINRKDLDRRIKTLV